MYNWKTIIFCILLIIVVCASCSREHKYARILKKEYASKLVGYKQLSVSIVDTVFTYDLNDSISSLKGIIDVEKARMDNYQTHLQECQTNLADAKRQRRQTYYFLMGLYDKLIESYQVLIQSDEDTIASIRTKMHADSVAIAVLDSLIVCTPPDSITFYVAKHEYDCGGGTVSELLYFNQDDEIYKTEYYEE